MPTYSELDDEYEVWVHREDICFDIPLCGLCANTGILDTRESAIWQGKKVGVRQHCICPNGRRLKRRNKGQGKIVGSGAKLEKEF